MNSNQSNAFLSMYSHNFIVRFRTEIEFYRLDKRYVSMWLRGFGYIHSMVEQLPQNNKSGKV